MIEDLEFEARPARIGAVARLHIVGDVASDVATFGLVLGVAALVVGVCAVVELVDWVHEEKKR